MRLLFVASIKYILIVILWQALELIFYGVVQHRIVDDIIGIILFWYIYQCESGGYKENDRHGSRGKPS